MKNFLFLLAFLVSSRVSFAQAEAAVTPTAGQKQAAEALLTALQMENLINQSIDQSIQMQLANNEKMRKYESVMRTFMARYMSWEVLKGPLTDVYAREFTEPELKELKAFYLTPVGKKALLKMPMMMQQGMAIGKSQVEAHLPELSQMIKDYDRKHENDFLKD